MASCVDAVILNTNARGGAGKWFWKKLLHSPEAQALNFNHAQIFDVATMSDPDTKLTQWVEQCLYRGCRHFAAVGGDGTVNMAANALYRFSEFQPVLGAVGIGSSNDFHKPVRNRIASFPCRLAFQSAFKHDVGEVSWSHHRRIFVINASVGYVAEANRYFNQHSRIKQWSANLGIWISAMIQFFRFKALPVNIQIDHYPVKKIQLVNAGIVKNIHFGGDFRYDNPGQPDDGYLGCYLCFDMSKFQMTRTIFSLLRGKFCGLPQTQMMRIKKMSLSSDTPVALETDGEVSTVTSFNVVVSPGGLLICP